MRSRRRCSSVIGRATLDGENGHARGTERSIATFSAPRDASVAVDGHGLEMLYMARE